VSCLPPQGLFSTFEYQPTQFNIADELASKQRVESEAKRLAVRADSSGTNTYLDQISAGMAADSLGGGCGALGSQDRTLTLQMLAV
jgi:hypothetical protein